MNRVIPISAVVLFLTGCAVNAYYTGDGTNVSMTQEYELPEAGVIHFYKGTAAEVREVCNTIAGTPDVPTLACILLPVEGGNVWRIYAPNKENALHEFKHFIYGNEHEEANY